MKALSRVVPVLLCLAIGCSSSGPAAAPERPAPDPVPAPAGPGSEAASAEETDDCESLEPTPESFATRRVRPPLDEFRRPPLEVYVFDLGQADSTLVVGPPPGRKSMLIDAGEPVTGEKENYAKLGTRLIEILGKAEIDYLVVSHYHTDHIGNRTSGVAGLIDHFDPSFKFGTLIDVQDDGAAFITGARRTYTDFDTSVSGWLSTGSIGSRIRPSFVDAGIDLGAGVKVEVVSFAGRAPGQTDSALESVAEDNPGHYEEAPASENDLSIALEISFGEFEFFTAGDLTGGPANKAFVVRTFPGGKKQTYTNVERLLLRRWEANQRESDVEVYRANHHGSAHSNGREFVGRLDPEFILFSCGGDYGHPERRVVKEASETARSLLTTDISKKTWGSGGDFADLHGQIVGEIRISVGKSGSWYRIAGEPHLCFSDQDEASNKDTNEENEKH